MAILGAYDTASACAVRVRDSRVPLGAGRGLPARDSRSFPGAASGLQDHHNDRVPDRARGRALQPEDRQRRVCELSIAKDVVRDSLVDEVLNGLVGQAQLLMAELVESGRLTRYDIRELQKAAGEADGQQKEERMLRSKCASDGGPSTWQSPVSRRSNSKRVEE